MAFDVFFNVNYMFLSVFPNQFTVNKKKRSISYDMFLQCVRFNSFI